MTPIKPPNNPRPCYLPGIHAKPPRLPRAVIVARLKARKEMRK